MSDIYTASIRIAAPPGEVFPYFTDPELLVRWMGDWAELQAKPGGAFDVNITGVPVRGEYLRVDPPHRLVFTWGVAGNELLPPGSSTVEISLHPDGDDTVLELLHRGLPADEVPKHRTGWDHYLPRLLSAAGGDDPGPDPWVQDQ